VIERELSGHDIDRQVALTTLADLEALWQEHGDGVPKIVDESRIGFLDVDRRVVGTVEVDRVDRSVIAVARIVDTHAENAKLAEAGQDRATELVRDDLAMLLGMPLHGGKQLVDRGCGVFASRHEVFGLPGMENDRAAHGGGRSALDRRGCPVVTRRGDVSASYPAGVARWLGHASGTPAAASPCR